MDTLVAKNVNGTELSVLEDAQKQLPTDSPLAAVLHTLTASVRGGVDVYVGNADEELSPAKVASLLKMSRPHVYKLLDAGVIPSARVGRDRRIRLSDLTTFMNAREDARRALAENFAHTGEDRTALVARLAGVDTATAQRLGF